MKKMLFMITVTGMSVVTGVHAQRCGTTEYYNSKINADQSVQQRIDAFEKITGGWISVHKSPATKFPKLEGFIPSGNENNDRIAYANAKQRHLQFDPAPASHVNEANLSTVEANRKLKQKTNSFIKIEGGLVK
jgi:hypothetical protein